MSFKKYIAFSVATIYFVATGALYAQTYHNSPTDTIIATIKSGETKVFNFIQQHPSKDTLILKWKKLSVNMPVGWDATICDFQHCYTNLPDTGTMNPITPGDDGIMSLHITAANEGKAVIKYFIFQPNVLQADTLTWIINSTISGIESEELSDPIISQSQSEITIHCNSFQFSEVSLYDITGKINPHYKIENDFIRLPIGYLHSGMYVILLKGQEYSSIKKFIIN
jgi:hypothetical protein